MILKAIRPIICVLLTLACFGMPVDFVSATSGPFRVIEHTVAVVLNEKGQAVVTEEICLETLSDVRNFSLDRQLAQDQKMTINKIAVSDSDAEAENRRMIELMPTDLSTDQAKAMTYQANLDKRLTSIDMHLFLKSDTKRLIQVSYTIDAAVQNHLDASFYQQRFFEIRNLIDPIGSATVRVSCSIPYAADKSWFLASSLTSFVAIETDDNSLYLKAQCQYFQELFMSRGYLYLNYIYESLGVKWNPDWENRCYRIENGPLRTKIYDGLGDVYFIEIDQ